MLWLLCIFFVSFNGEAQEYVIRYQSLTSGSVFHVETIDGERIGKVIREQQNENVDYTLFGKEEQILASAKTVRYKADTIVTLIDPKGEDIGWFAAQIYNLYPTEYKVYASQNRLVAKGFMNWLGNSFALTDPNNPKAYLVTFLRPRFKLFNDNWHFQVHTEGAIDFRILCVIGTFQTACDLKFEQL